MERRLSAILAADVVGYSRLMERDEADPFQRLRVHRQELFEPEIGKHYGRIFKLMGDGLLAEFGRVVDAVACAVALQRGMVERNKGIGEDRRIDVRIGVNLGDVIIEGEDRHGEGVNIAVRLEQLSEPGGICISQQAYDQVESSCASAQAKATLDHILTRHPRFADDRRAAFVACRMPRDLVEGIMDGLRKAGIQVPPAPVGT
jgi:adenylate cyclase